MKTNSKLFASLLLVLFPFFLQSCDPVTTYEVYVDNRSNDTLLLRFSSQDSALYAFRDTLVLPKELLQLKTWEMRGKNRQYECEVFRSGVTLSTPNGKLSTKDGTDPSDWTSIYTREGLLWQCFLQIKDEDLQ